MKEKFEIDSKLYIYIYVYIFISNLYLEFMFILYLNMTTSKVFEKQKVENRER